nr:hypothetical protein [Paenibacillus sp. PCH8]
MDYIKWIRSKVGSEMIILNFAGAIIVNEAGQYCCNVEEINMLGAFQEELWNWRIC